MTLCHTLDLQEPNVEEYNVARNMWILNKAKSSPKELETLTCDYDSETGRRYSEDESETESETESNSEDISDHDEIQISTEPQSPSDSEDDNDHLNDEEEELPNMLSREKYELERRKSSSNMENRFNEIEDTIEQIWTTNDTLKNSNDSKNRELDNLKEGFTDLMSSLEHEKLERATLRSQMKTLLASNV